MRQATRQCPNLRTYDCFVRARGLRSPRPDTPTDDETIMNPDPSQPPIEPAEARHDSERNVLLVTYVLYGLSAFIFVTAVAGVIINHIKLGELGGETVAHSHHRWLMRTFWFSILWSVVCLILTPIVIGVVGYFMLWVWCAYRFIRGMLTFADGRAMPV